MSAKVWNLALVGCGGMGGAHLESLLETGRCRLVSAVDINPARAQDYKERYGAERWATDYRAELGRGDIEMVVVATIPSAHAAAAIMALEQGRHVLCEKPVSNNMADARRVVAAAHSSRGKILIGHQLRYLEPWPELISELRGGALGRPMVMRMAGNQMTFGEIWKTQQRLIKDTSPLIDCGVHYVDIMRLIAGCEPLEVYAQGVNLAPDVLPANAYNYGLLQVKFADGSLGHYEAGWGPMMTLNSWHIKDFSGPKGSCSLLYELDHNSPDNPPTSSSHTIRRRSIPSCDCEYAETVETEWRSGPNPVTKGSSLGNMHRYFLDALESGKDLTDELLAACAALEIVLAADESIKTGKAIKLGGCHEDQEP